MTTEQKAASKVGKLWCDHCRNYTRHERQEGKGTATCLACGQKHVVFSEFTGSKLETINDKSGSLLLRIPQLHSKEKKTYRFVLSEAKLILESTQQLNHFIKKSNLPIKPLSENELQQLITDLNEFLRSS